jgi:GMC oxidoreductase
MSSGESAEPGGPPRRAVISAIPVAVTSTLILGVDGCTSRPAQETAARFFTSHETAVVEEATARIAPGPTDDPAEAGHPGVREAGVVNYIDNVYVADGSVFVTSGAHNPTMTIMAVALRNMRHLAGVLRGSLLHVFVSTYA